MDGRSVRKTNKWRRLALEDVRKCCRKRPVTLRVGGWVGWLVAGAPNQTLMSEALCPTADRFAIGSLGDDNGKRIRWQIELAGRHRSLAARYQRPTCAAAAGNNRPKIISFVSVSHVYRSAKGEIDSSASSHWASSLSTLKKVQFHLV
jgi:hypothetical protein